MRNQNRMTVCLQVSDHQDHIRGENVYSSHHCKRGGSKIIYRLSWCTVCPRKV